MASIRIIFTIISLLNLYSCFSFAKTRPLAHEGMLLENKPTTISATLSTHNLIGKSGKQTDIRELYLNYLDASYYVKLCEGNALIKKNLFELASSTHPSLLKVELRDGYWDICEENYEQQSRVGSYIVIHEIKN